MEGKQQEEPTAMPVRLAWKITQHIAPLYGETSVVCMILAWVYSQSSISDAVCPISLDGPLNKS